MPEIDKPARAGDSGEGQPVEDTPLSQAHPPRLDAQGAVTDTPGNRPEVGSDDNLAIVVRGLMNQFGEQIVHRNLDLNVRRGEILGVVGGSGTGKSVLMRSILGLNTPKAGKITVFGIDAQSENEAERRKIELNSGVLFQDGALFSSLTVAENVAVPLKEHHKDIDEDLRDQLVRLKIRLAGLPDGAADKLPAQLSGGMRKRAGLARALALDPDLLFLDEPTAGLDPIGAAAFDQLILTLQQALGFTVFLITHDLDTLYAICNRVAVLADQRVLINAPIRQVEKFDHPWVQEYFHGPRGRAAQRAIGES
jgi:phospholipid/cholesterol/gamma-HCH transport system ATP-binding protein